jgi:hypothetical protein
MLKSLLIRPRLEDYNRIMRKGQVAELELAVLLAGLEMEVE